MPRVTFVKKARKKNPAVKAGESYYWWKFRYGSKHYSVTPPKQSQLTQSSKLSTIYATQEAVDALPSSWSPTSYDDTDKQEVADGIRAVADAFREGVETLRGVAEEYEESASNMEEYFQNSSQVDEIRDKGQAVEGSADEWDNVADELESAADTLDGLDVYADEGEWTEEEDWDESERDEYISQFDSAVSDAENAIDTDVDLG
jgi:hypothetical protein